MNVIETLFVNQLNMESVHGYRNRHHSFVILSFNKKATTKSDNKKATAKTQQQLQEIQTKMNTNWKKFAKLSDKKTERKNL